MLVPDVVAPTGERAKLLDFGLAKLARDTAQAGQATRSNHIMGTPTYMSPEQCRGAGIVDDKSDVYSLGVMLYQMLAGRAPFVAEGAGELISKHITDEPPPLSQLAPQLQPELVELVHRLLRKDKAQRPSMCEVVAALERHEARQGSAGIRSTGATLPTGATGGGLELHIAGSNLKAMLAGTLELETEEERSAGGITRSTLESSQSPMVYERTMPSGDLSPTLNGVTQISGPSSPLIVGEFPLPEGRSHRWRAPLLISLLAGMICTPVAWRLFTMTSTSSAPARALTTSAATRPAPAAVIKETTPVPVPSHEKSAAPITAAPIATPIATPTATPIAAPVPDKEKPAPRNGNRAKPAPRPQRPTPPVTSKPADASKSEFKLID